MATALGVKSKAALRIDGKSTSGIAPDLSEYPTTTTEASDERCALKYCDGIPMKSESMEAGMNFEEDETLLGGAGAISQDNVSKLPSGSISMTGRYNGLDAVFALALGYEEVYRNSDFYPSSMSETALTAGTCSASTFVNSTGVFASSDEGKFIKMVGTDANSGQIRRISGYNSTTSVDVTPNWDDTPDSGDSAELAEFFTHLFHTSQNAHDELLSDIRTDWSTRATNSIFGANDKVIRRGYLGVYKGDASYTNFSRAVKADSLEISCQAGGSMEVTLGLNAFDRLRSTASISDITKWGDPDWNSENLQDNYQDKLREKVMFNDLSGIYVAPHETLLGSDHARKISGFTISLNNNLQSEDLTAVSGLYRTEPVRGGMKEITGSFTIPRYDSDTWLAWRDDQEILDVQINFNGSQNIVGTSDHLLEIDLHSIRIQSVSAPVGGGGALTQEVSWKAYIPTSYNTGFIAPSVWKDSQGKTEMTIRVQNFNPFNAYLDQNKEY